MKRKRELETGTKCMSREYDRLSKARHRGLESETLLRKKQNKAFMAKKSLNRVLEPESKALLRKEWEKASKTCAVLG